MKDLQFLNYLNERIDHNEGMALCFRNLGRESKAKEHDIAKDEAIKNKTEFLNIYKS